MSEPSSQSGKVPAKAAAKTKAPADIHVPGAPTLRGSMNWLHTWAGIVLGGVLLAIFWMGTLSVFDREIDRWMMPMTRVAQTEALSLDAVRSIGERLGAGAEQWSITLPTGRSPTLIVRAYGEEAGIDVRRHADPATGALLPDPGTLGGTGFIFPFHFMLHVEFLDLGYWIVGLAGIAMIVLSISGVIIHKKIFADFFTLRFLRKTQRTTLDLHNLSGVFGLPFNVMIALSGLIIFFSIYMPQPQELLYKQGEATFSEEAYGRFEREASGTPGTLGSLDAMRAEAVRRWGEEPYFVRVWRPGDAASYVEMRRPYDRGVTMHIDALYFDASSGAVLYATPPQQPVMNAQRFISGMHFIQFKHWTLRWLYFAAGLLGCALIATGLLFWAQSRRKHHEKLGLKGVAIVDGLAVGATTGIVIATLAFFIANRLLPLETPGRAGLEMWAFYMIWLATFAHAWLAPRRAWGEQCAAIAVGGVLAVALNWITTGDHVVAAAARGQWGVAGMDLLMLAGALIAAVTARRLLARAAPTPSNPLPQPASASIAAE